MNQLERRYASAPPLRRAPVFRIFYDDNGFVNALCQSCEASGAMRKFGVGRFQDRAERGLSLLRINMAEHAATNHTHR